MHFACVCLSVFVDAVTVRAHTHCRDNGGTFAPSLQSNYTAGRWVQQPTAWSDDAESTITLGMATPPPSGQFKNGTYASSLHAFLPVVHGFCLLGASRELTNAQSASNSVAVGILVV